MNEVELKLRVPKARAAAVDAAVGGRTPSPRIGLTASYWDTPDQALAAAKVALRVRREGRRRVQTVKALGKDPLTRLEHEVAAVGDVPDPALHAGTPAGARLAELLAEARADGQVSVPGGTLVRRFESIVKRRTRLLRTPDGQVELAFDTGRIAAGERSVPVCELEIELKQGTPAAVYATARRWIAQHELWIDLRSKAAIGARLASGAAVPAVSARPLKLDPSATPDAALRAMVGNALDQVLNNAAELADGAGTPEQLHQCRIGLRRLRTALREFGSFSAHVEAGWADALGALFAELGVQRDRDALAADLWPQLEAAGGPPLDAARAARSDDAVGALLRGAPFNLLMLDLMAFAHHGPGEAAPAPLGADGPAQPLVEAVSARLRKLRKRIVADAAGFAALAPEAQHRVRKQLKRLRYAVEFSAALFPKRALRRFLRELRPAQDALGALNDLAVAQALLEARRDEGSAVWFGLGWLAARREAAALACEAALVQLAKAARPWAVRRRARS